MVCGLDITGAKVCSYPDEAGAVAPPVVLERGVDVELDDRRRRNLQVLDGLAGQLPEPAGGDGGRPGVGAGCGVSTAAISVRAAGGRGVVRPRSEERRGG